MTNGYRILGFGFELEDEIGNWLIEAYYSALRQAHTHENRDDTLRRRADDLAGVCIPASPIALGDNTTVVHNYHATGMVFLGKRQGGSE